MTAASTDDSEVTVCWALTGKTRAREAAVSMSAGVDSTVRRPAT